MCINWFTVSVTSLKSILGWISFACLELRLGVTTTKFDRLTVVPSNWLSLLFVLHPLEPLKLTIQENKKKLQNNWNPENFINLYR